MLISQKKLAASIPMYQSIFRKTVRAFAFAFAFATTAKATKTPPNKLKVRYKSLLISLLSSAKQQR